MSRILCSNCHRPEAACICQFSYAINNSIHVVFLVHPKEVNHTKGSLPLLVNSLKNHTVLVGENFTDNEQLNKLISQYQGDVALLYPSESASSLTAKPNHSPHKNNPQQYKCLIVIDATWKKAYRMYMLSSNLLPIKHVMLSDNIISQYQIRKTNKKNALSTLEACCNALAILENSPNKYDNLLDKFVEFNQFQLSFRP